MPYRNCLSQPACLSSETGPTRGGCGRPTTMGTNYKLRNTGSTPPPRSDTGTPCLRIAQPCNPQYGRALPDTLRPAPSRPTLPGTPHSVDLLPRPSPNAPPATRSSAAGRCSRSSSRVQSRAQSRPVPLLDRPGLTRLRNPPAFRRRQTTTSPPSHPAFAGWHPPLGRLLCRLFPSWLTHFLRHIGRQQGPHTLIH